MINFKSVAIQLKSIKVRKRLLILISIKKFLIFLQIKMLKLKVWYSVIIRDRVSMLIVLKK
jgi:hypothetical protein